MIIQVSDHALMRWLERRHGIDLTPLRDMIMRSPEAGGIARDKMVVRFLERNGVDLEPLRRRLIQLVEEALDRDGLDEAGRMRARIANLDGGWRLPLSAHPGGRSISTVIEPSMEWGRGTGGQQ